MKDLKLLIGVGISLALFSCSDEITPITSITAEGGEEGGIQGKACQNDLWPCTGWGGLGVRGYCDTCEEWIPGIDETDYYGDFYIQNWHYDKHFVWEISERHWIHAAFWISDPEGSIEVGTSPSERFDGDVHDFG